MEQQGIRKKQKELDKIIKAYDDYIDDKMMNDWLEGDDDWEVNPQTWVL